MKIVDHTLTSIVNAVEALAETMKEAPDDQGIRIMLTEECDFWMLPVYYSDDMYVACYYVNPKEESDEAEPFLTIRVDQFRPFAVGILYAYQEILSRKYSDAN